MKGFMHRLYSNAILLRNTIFPKFRSSYLEIPLTDADEFDFAASEDKDLLRDLLTIGALFTVIMLIIVAFLPKKDN